MAITAWSHGIGSCILGSINKKTLSEAVKIPTDFVVCMVLALGYPDHKSTIVEAGTEDSLNYIEGLTYGDRSYQKDSSLWRKAVRRFIKCMDPLSGSIRI